MKFQVTHKTLALGGDYTVRDESGSQVLYFDGKVFNFGGKKIVVLDAKGKEVARIRKKLLSFYPAYVVRRKGNIPTIIRKCGFSIRNDFIIDVPGSNDMRVVGDFIAHEYTIKRGSVDVARVSKKFFSAVDSYGVDIQSGDPVILLSAVVVIDMVLYKKVK